MFYGSFIKKKEKPIDFTYSCIYNFCKCYFSAYISNSAQSTDLCTALTTLSPCSSGEECTVSNGHPSCVAQK